MAGAIEDYAVIGAGETMALISVDGSLDWLCAPRFDSPACFAALLGGPEHGRWRLAPAGPPAQARRRYEPETLILETRYESAAGAAVVTEFMDRRDGVGDVVRVVRGERGRLAFATELIVRFDYGSDVPWASRQKDGRLRFIAGPDALYLQTPVELHGEGLKTVGAFTVGAGETLAFVLTYGRSFDPPPGPIDAEAALDRVRAGWRRWAARFAIEGPWREACLRSANVLKALIHWRTGAMVAAPTTSLPERLGGTRNWDYRYCWLRDATSTLYALISAGFLEEARGWREWLLRAAAGSPQDLQIMYGLGGERRLTEYELSHLPGYRGSRPVRVGNAAAGQLQIDVYGEVLDTMFAARCAGLAPDPEAWALETALLGRLETIWKEPDFGMWEIRGQPRHFTHSKVMAWVAFDRGVRSVEDFGLEGPVERWRAIRAEIHGQVCERGFDAGRGSFVQSYGVDRLDASLLLIPVVGFLPAAHPKVAGTIAAIEAELLRDGLVIRYDTGSGVDGLEPGEGAFLACSFWLADAWVLQGRRKEAEALFERLVGLANDVGLLAEEYDPVARRQLGNFPQAFSHLAMINTAHNLASAEGPAHQRARCPFSAGMTA